MKPISAFLHRWTWSVVLLVLCSFAYHGANAQTIAVCPPEQLDLPAELQAQLNSCGNDSYINITASSVPGVSNGNVSGPFSISGDGQLTLEIVSSTNTVCQTLTIQIDWIETQFTYSTSGCHIIDITGADNPSGCSYTYTINGQNYGGQNLSNIPLPNGGQYDVTVQVVCGSCVQTNTYSINAGDPEAALSFDSDEAYYFDPGFEAWVICTSLDDATVEITDVSQVSGGGATYDMEITNPSGLITNINTEPNPYSLLLDEEGLYLISYTVIDNGCPSQVTYQLFNSNPDVAVELSTNFTLEASYCQDETIEVSVCPDGDCASNPPGTIYTVELTCSNYYFETTTIPFTAQVPLAASSCNSNCVSGNCSCDLILTANRPCVDAVTNTICPVKVSPAPDANYTKSPNDPQNTYCTNETVQFTADWEGTDCNGPNPLPSLCENQNPMYTVVPATGWSVVSGALDQYQVEINFTQPGSYEVCYSAENSCGITANYCESLCILDDTPPTVTWENSNIVCVGTTYFPEVAFSTVACANTQISWGSSDSEITMSDPNSNTPELVFTSPGEFDLNLGVSGLCQPFSETATYQVCDVPAFNVVQPEVNLCLFQEFCLADVLSMVWNNCTGDIIWTVPGAPGSPFLNPSPDDLCLSWDAPDNIVVTIEASNDCGTTVQTIDVNIETSPACPITSPGEFCEGDQISISPPTGATNPTWYFSTDGTIFQELTGGMPDNPSETTWYYVESTVNGCFCISDTVQATLIPTPVFDLQVTNTAPCPGEPVTLSLDPPQGNVNWYEGSDLFATSPEYTFTPAGAINITAELIYGGITEQCSISEDVTITPVTNPISLDCSSIPALWCEGDAIQPLPSASPSGGTFHISDGTDILFSAITEIDPDVLGTGNFELIYEYSTTTPSICTFTESCAFTITAPQIPQIVPAVDTLCYYSTVNFEEQTGLLGTWSSNCPGAIDASGLFDPSAASCTEGTTIEIYYTGDCILNQTLDVYLIPEESISIVASNPSPCDGELVTFSISPIEENVFWEDQFANNLGSGSSIDVQITEALDITATLSYGTNDVVCTAEADISITPLSNPISLDCSGIPSLWCEGDPAQPLPTVSPGGGNFYITDGFVEVLSGMSEIDPTVLGTGSFYLVYEYQSTAPSVCTFLDSCAFEITAPQIPQISPQIDTLCYYATIDFDELTELSGDWSSNCPGAISADGLFDPTAANCPEGTVVEIYYTGDCILNETMEIYLIPDQDFTIEVSNTIPCPGDLVTFTTNPPQANLEWFLNGSTSLGSGSSVDLNITEPVEISAISTYGSFTVTCQTEASLDISPEVNPITLNCPSWPSPWCVGDGSLSLPNSTPVGGIFRITDGTNTVLSNPTEINPEVLPEGSYYLVYQVDNIGPSACTFLDSCAFEIVSPENPQINPVPQSLCFNETVQLTDLAGLGGTFSSDCPDLITTDGFIDPTASTCTPGSTVEIYYSGDCILNDTLNLFLIPIPTISLDLAQTDICANECLAMNATITGAYETAIWQLDWAGGQATIDLSADFCPDGLGINSSVLVSAELIVQTDSEPACSVLASETLNIIRIPDEGFEIESPQCIANEIELPECDECEGYIISFTNENNQTFDCTFPGGSCNLPDTGMYSYEIIYDYGVCQGDPITGQFHQVDAPYLNILSLAYDSCAPVAIYQMAYGLYDYDVIWEHHGDLISTIQTSPDTFVTTIDHNVNIEVDTVYNDIITISNMCGTVSDSRTVYHMALPDFTLDPDSVVYCDNALVPIEIGFAQPLHVDSISIAFFYNGDVRETLTDIPLEPIIYQFNSSNDTLEVNFEVTSYNPCGSISKSLTAFVLPTDVSADLDILAPSPLCPGDTIPLVINSTGNINYDLREVTTNNFLLEPVQILGEWYLLPQEELPDGIYSVQLTEIGFCGVDAAVANVAIGPSLNVSFFADDVCDGGPVTFIPNISQPAELTWEFQPDSFSYQDFPSPFLYENPGVYYPVLTAENPDYCPAVYSEPVQVFAGELPRVVCDASCDGSLGCQVDFNDEFICARVSNEAQFVYFEWRVNGQFYPEYEEEISIPIELLKPCGNNTVTLETIDVNGCASRMRRRIDFNDALIHIPNSFTPNADGINDVFRPVIYGDPYEYNFAVFDRWGRKVFESTDPQEPWLGDALDDSYYLEADTYIYILNWKPCNRAEDKMKEITGHVTLVR